MTNAIPQFLIAAPHSGSGKTTLSRALMAALVKRGLRVQPYKCGPDYIDTKFHAAVCHRPSYNLDTFMASAAHVREIYERQATGADACVVEGMMGLFDGYERDRGSSAEVARLLGLPVVLVVDARSAAYSIAPLLMGLRTFRPGVDIVGVIFNKVGSKKHERMLREAAEDAGVECLGCLPKHADLEQGSRYLGLDFSTMKGEEAADELATWVSEHVDIDRLLALSTKPLHTRSSAPSQGSETIAVLRNAEAFSFLYAEHLDLLNQRGRVVFLDPESDTSLPPDLSLLYLPGGYPERNSIALTANKAIMRDIRRYIQDGGRALAECGGMIYLSRGILFDDVEVPLCGVLPFIISARQAERRLSLGYRQLTYNQQALRGHEFHYTQFAPDATLPESVAEVSDARGERVATPFFRYKNLLASYAHLYWGEADLDQLFNL